ncbi:hypothetical protein EYF80_031817 [Liparis tanakae]|uniref:Uncharacterized protein n=1 Tax=Liparis tanakae TaxID=230148 RepID=A0A4Z2GYZ2_9TELE|nr:hypothetical protein EYF80_031817 [Liparis tanakae]
MGTGGRRGNSSHLLADTTASEGLVDLVPLKSLWESASSSEASSTTRRPPPVRRAVLPKEGSVPRLKKTHKKATERRETKRSVSEGSRRGLDATRVLLNAHSCALGVRELTSRPMASEASVASSSSLCSFLRAARAR